MEMYKQHTNAFLTMFKDSRASLKPKLIQQPKKAVKPIGMGEPGAISILVLAEAKPTKKELRDWIILRIKSLEAQEHAK